MTQPALEATNRLLFSSTDLTAIVGNRIHEDYAPPSATWPLINYFPVTGQSSYLVDFDKTTVQISMWATSKYELANIKKIVYSIFNRYRGHVDTYLSDGDRHINRIFTDGSLKYFAPLTQVYISWASLDDQGQLNPGDYPIYGYFYRFRLRVRGKNIGGI